MELEARARTILQLVVEAYIDDAQPVSSTAVARRSKSLKLSPATIRAVMADLEHQGLLQQPHTSAGRVPTEQGLRVYLDGLMSPKLHPWDRSRLDAAAAESDPVDLPASLGYSLAGLSGQLAVVAVPRLVGTRFREIGLVRCDAGRILAYFVSPGGLVQQKLVEVDFDLSADELTRLSNFLNAHISGRSLEDVRALVREELAQAEPQEPLRTQAYELCRRALPEGDLKLFVEGAAQLVNQPEFADLERLRAVMRAVDDRGALLKLLERIFDGQGVQVVLGSEHQMRGAHELVCVGSSWNGSRGGRVAISLLGPQRMDYGRAVSLIRYATELFDRYWQRL